MACVTNGMCNEWETTEWPQIESDLKRNIQQHIKYVKTIHGHVFIVFVEVLFGQLQL